MTRMSRSVDIAVITEPTAKPQGWPAATVFGRTGRTRGRQRHRGDVSQQLPGGVGVTFWIWFTAIPTSLMMSVMIVITTSGQSTSSTARLPALIATRRPEVTGCAGYRSRPASDGRLVDRRLNQ